ncbi:F-box/WD repeat-containing protein [Criblamydia sequanensis]|uniref:Membrane protein n=1 Tax=Candidatus Criblamydia sequanensis CRIB-18 TaxID=1437425 RepID=A0A090DYT7_9BACT|nr:F-box-like domain-containing protein [Criblamydia sequanensis]CDR33864.1 putative membrane protein [Criblamydia sequanensis CRIB-18]
MNDLITSLNPFSPKYHALEDFNKLTLLSKLTVIFVTTLASIATAFICTSLVFRLLVGRLKPLDPTKDTPQNDLAHKIESIANPVLSKSNLPSNEELLLHLFSFLDRNSLFNAMQVCRDFRRIGADDTLWKGKTGFDSPKDGMSFFQKYLKKKEIAFRLKSEGCQPKVTKVKNIYETNDIYGNYIISFKANNELRIYDVDTGETKFFQEPCINCIQIYGNKLFVGSNGFVDLYDLITGNLLRTFIFKESNFSKVKGVFVQEGKVFGAFHNKLVVWDLETGVKQKILKGGHLSNLQRVFCHDSYIITFDEDQMQVIWDLEKGSFLDRVSAHPLAIYEGKLITWRNSDNLMAFYDFKTKDSETLRFFIPEDHSSESQIHIDANLLLNRLIIRSSFKITVGDLKENKLLYNLSPAQESERGEEEFRFAKVSISHGKIIASVESKESGVSAKIFAWDFETGTLIYSFPIENFTGFLILEEEKVILCGSFNKLEVWDLETGLYKRCIPTLDDLKIVFSMHEGKILLENQKELALLDFSKKGEDAKSKGCVLF